MAKQGTWKISRSAATEKCADDGATLAEINSVGEQRFIEHLKPIKAKWSYWIGTYMKLGSIHKATLGILFRHEDHG